MMGRNVGGACQFRIFRKQISRQSGKCKRCIEGNPHKIKRRGSRVGRESLQTMMKI